jgi:hypothetical protein
MRLLADARLGWIARGVLLAVAGSGLLLALVGFDVVAHLPHFSVCVFRALTEFDCAGCGLTRALLRLGQLDASAALMLNPLAPFVLVAIGWLAMGAPRAAWPSRAAVPQIALVAVLLLWGLRALGFAPAA